MDRYKLLGHFSPELWDWWRSVCLEVKNFLVLFEASILRLNQPLPKPSSWPVGWCIVGNLGTRLWQGRRICGVKIDDIRVQNCPPSPTVLLKCDAKSVETHLSRGGFHHEPQSIKKTESCRRGNKPLRLLAGLSGGLLSSLSLRATSQKNLKSASACGDTILKSCHWGIRISYKLMHI